MGEARKKRIAEEERIRAEERRRREERARWNAPRGRRVAKPLRVELDGARYELHADGSVYEVVRGKGILTPGGPAPVRRVKDRAIVEAVQTRAAQLSQARTSATPAEAVRA